MGMFDIIAPIYALFYDKQIAYFKKILDKAKLEMDISQYENVLDIGCGSGALAKTMFDVGLQVTGVDPSKKMIEQAKKRLETTSVKLLAIDPEERLPFEDKSFDVIIASYVIHGLQKEERFKLYYEMKRIAKHRVIIHDYNKNRRLITDIIEWLEGGDYFNYINVAEDEMRSIFEEVKVLDIDNRAAWYMCCCK